MQRRFRETQVATPTSIASETLVRIAALYAVEAKTSAKATSNTVHPSA